MQETNQLLAFSIDKHVYALPYSIIERVVQAVEITPLPNSAEIIEGIINVHGFVIPVINLRRKMNLQDKEVELSDKFIITKTSKRTVALIADDIQGLIEAQDDNIVTMDKIIPNPKMFSGTVKLKNDIVLIYDTDKFLSKKEEADLQQILGEDED
ncbi:MAG: chemotaxis protein CheW [bacterium]|nr:chemotaxis protein CheW [bacterium]